MESPEGTYISLIQAFLRGELTGDELQSRYFHRFKRESRPMSDELFQVLDTIFADLDSFVPDDKLLADLRQGDARPVWNLDEGELRGRLEEHVVRLAKLERW